MLPDRVANVQSTRLGCDDAAALAGQFDDDLGADGALERGIRHDAQLAAAFDFDGIVAQFAQIALA